MTPRQSVTQDDALPYASDDAIQIVVVPSTSEENNEQENKQIMPMTSSYKRLLSTHLSSGYIRLRSLSGTIDTKLSNKVIGQGHQGRVLEGNNYHAPEISYAVKEIPISDAAIHEEMLHQLVNKIRKDNPDCDLNRLIIPYYQGEYNFTIYQFMFHAKGNNADQLIEKLSQLPLHDQLVIKQHIAKSYLQLFFNMNKHGIYHRDLKPENMLFDDKGDCYLCDWGSAMVIDEQGGILYQSLDLKTTAKYHTHVDIADADNRLRNALEIKEAYTLGLSLYIIFCHITNKDRESIEFNALNLNKVAAHLKRFDIPDEFCEIIIGLLTTGLVNYQGMRVSEAWACIQPLNDVSHQEVERIFTSLYVDKKEAENYSVTSSLRTQGTFGLQKESPENNSSLKEAGRFTLSFSHGE